MNTHLKIIPIIFMIVVVVSGCITDTQTIDDTHEENNDGSSQENENLTGAIMFDYPPVDLEKVCYILPMGFMDGGHVTPVDHQYYITYDYDFSDDVSVDVDVYSPGAGRVISIEHMGEAAGDTPLPVDDYRIEIEHTSTFSSIFIHIDELSEKLLAVAPPLGEYKTVDVAVDAGEIIGKYGGSIDYNIVDEEIVLSGFVVPESYAWEPWKIHCADPFNYFNEPLHSQLIEKCVRIDEPLGGKIDYDIDGKLIGTWFEENTNKYQGLALGRYWAGHLSIVYDYVDTDHIIISIGTFVDTAEQFGVKGNAPDPADVDSETGIVKYELVGYDYYTGDELWDRTSLVKGLQVRNNDYMQGVICVQLIEDRRLQVEIFPDMTAADVDGFTENFLIFER